MNTNKYEFLSSTRFWALVTGSLSTILIDPNLIAQPWYVTVGKFLGLVSAGFIAIRTIDRASEQKVVAAGVTSGQVSAANATDIPSEE